MPVVVFPILSGHIAVLQTSIIPIARPHPRELVVGPRGRWADPQLLVLDVGHYHRTPSNVLTVGSEDTRGRIGLIVVLHIHLAPKLDLFHVAGTTDGTRLFTGLGKDWEKNGRQNRYYRNNDKQLY